MPITTMVRVGDGGPLDVGEGCFGPSSKRQPKGLGHSTRACKRVPQEASNLERAIVGVELVGGGGGEPAR
jgi:hypothetical protein